MSRVVVVGAGLGGLAVAARLARLRHDVVVLEAADVVGGAAGAVSRDGFTWDTGPQLVTLPAAVRDLFIKTGKPLESVVELQPLDVLARCVFADGTSMDQPNAGVNDVAAAFDGALGGDSGEAWRRFHAHAAETWALIRGPLVEASLPSRRELFRRPQLARALSPRRTLRELGERFFSDPRQRAFLERYALEIGTDPRRAPAWLCIRPYVEQTFGGWTVPGGLRRLVEAVHVRAVERGAVVHTDARVIAVTTAAGRVDGVRLEDGRVMPADVVISDVDIRHLHGDLLPGAVAHDPPTASASVFTLLLGLRGESPGMAQRTLLFPDAPDAELDAVFDESPRVVDDPTMSVHVSRHRAHAPEGGEAWTIQVAAARHGVGPGAINWSEDVAAGYAHRLIERMALRGLDVRDRLAVMQHRSPADLEQATGRLGGGAYGAALHAPKAAWLRAANRSATSGLFLVGSDAHPGGGLPLVTMSAAIVAETIGRA